MGGLATVSGLNVDKYEITVGRFRAFVSAVAQGWLPAAGSGKHAYLNGGKGLLDTGDSTGTSYESGWDGSWNAKLATTSAGWNDNLSCNSLATWTPDPGGNENRPITCVTWYEVYAFCIWDGGFLPSDAEWNYVASGGSEQRFYPWSSPPSSQEIDCTYANYDGGSNGPAGFCTAGGTNDVGSESPKGNGKWGQADLAGNVWEWVLDKTTGFNTCTDCALTSLPSNALPSPLPGFPPDGDIRTIRGGGLGSSPNTALFSTPPASDRSIEEGARCARAP
jgi:formylglycine-generating enzyme required for sulfatase activity